MTDKKYHISFFFFFTLSSLFFMPANKNMVKIGRIQEFPSNYTYIFFPPNHFCSQRCADFTKSFSHAVHSYTYIYIVYIYTTKNFFFTPFSTFQIFWNRVHSCGKTVDSFSFRKWNWVLYLFSRSISTNKLFFLAFYWNIFLSVNIFSMIWFYVICTRC